MHRQKEKVDDAYPLHRMRKKQMEHTWTKEFYQETDPAKRQHILKEHIGEEEAGKKNTEPGSGQPDTDNAGSRRMNLSNA